MKATVVIVLPVDVDRAATGDVQALARRVQALGDRLAGQVLADGIRAGEPASAFLPLPPEQIAEVLSLLTGTRT